MGKYSTESVKDQYQSPRNDNRPLAAKAPPKLVHVAPIPKLKPIVDGAKLLDDLVSTFNQYLVLPEHAAETLALWVLFAHTFDAWQFSPRLILKSATPESGKTTVLRVLKALIPGAMVSTYASEAAIRRQFDEGTPVLLDEADTFFKDKPQLKPSLNAGFDRDGMALLTKSDKKTGEITLQRLSLWAPVVIAGIGDTWLWPALRTRSFVFNLKKKLPGEKVDEWDKDAAKGVQQIGGTAAVWGEQNIAALEVAKPEMPTDLHNRQRDNWKPLIAIADAAGGAWPEQVRRIARILSGGKPELDENVKVLAATKEIFDEKQVGKLRSALLVAELQKHGDWGMDEKMLAAALKDFDIKPKQMKFVGNKNLQGYRREQFEDAWARYLE